METFENEVVQIALLAGNDGVIRDTAFEGCHVKGPAVIAPRNTDFAHNTLDAPDTDALLWEVPPERKRIVGAILVEDCAFRGCTFSMVGITGPKALVDQFRDS